MKFTIELDLDLESDRQIIELVSAFKAKQAQGEQPTLQSLLPTKNFPSVTPKVEAGKEINQAANALSAAVGNNSQSKLSNEERARVAAKARWARKKAIDNGLPVPPRAQKKKKLNRDPQFDGAEKQDASVFGIVPATEGPLDFVEDSPFPDGRELIDGTWKYKNPSQRPPQQEEFAIEEHHFDGADVEDGFDLEKELQDARDIAAKY